MNQDASQPRIAPLAPAEFTDEQRALLAPVTDAKGRVFNVFGTLIRNTELFKSWMTFGQYTMAGSRMDVASREVLILRVAANVGSDYEWAHHVRIGKKLGLEADALARIKNGDMLGEPEHDLMLRCVDDLTTNFMLSDDSWNAMIEAYDFEYTTDTIFTVGAYVMLSMALKSCGVQVEGGH